MTTVGKQKLIEQLMLIPDELLIYEINDFKYSLVVSARLGDTITTTVKIAFDWFFVQKHWKKVIIKDLNGVDITMERTE